MVIILLVNFFSLGVHASLPRPLNFGATVGPDGPWHALTNKMSWPQQNVTFLPSLTKTNLLVHSDACSDPRSACPRSEYALWVGLQGTWSWMNSTKFEASILDASLAPLNLSGQASYISDRVTIDSPGQNSAYLDFTANAVESNVNVNLPSNSAWYTLNTGFFSLYGGDKHVNYTSVNGSEISLNTTLPLAFSKDAIPSPFYGLHIGSASPEVMIPGSLVLGGYDKSRCLTNLITSDTDTFTLEDIGLSVATGDSPFPKDSHTPVRKLLRSRGDAVINAYPNPGVPYLHLPSETCQAISEHLPLIFEETLGLYLWNTSAHSYRDILTTPSSLFFDFKLGSTTSTIHIPFALLNLTLEWPLVDTPTQYFPCSPYEPLDGRYHLGRAFLQAAFMAQNWQTGKLMLAQAPGPDFSDTMLATISSNDTIVSPMVKAPTWNATWSSKLKAIERSGAESGNRPITNNNHISSGSIAGIVVGVLVLALLVGGSSWAWFRRRRTAVAHTDDETRQLEHFQGHDEGSMAVSKPSEVWAPSKHGLTLDPI